MIVARQSFGSEHCLQPSEGRASLTNMCSPTPSSAAYDVRPIEED